MSRKRTAPAPSKIPPGVKRETGVLSCKVCKFTVPFAGFTDESIEPRPTHRCIERTIRAFDKFDTNPPKMIRRQW